MKELRKPIDPENQEKELFAEAMCTEASCSCGMNSGGFYNASLNEEDDILF